MAEPLELTVLVGDADADSDEIDRATRRLRSELQELPVDSVSLAPGERPAGAKAADPISLGALIISLAPVVVPPLLEFLKSWIARKDGRRIVVRSKVAGSGTEIEINAALSESQISALLEQISISPQRPPAGT